LPWEWCVQVGRFGMLAAAYQLVSPSTSSSLLPVWAAFLVLLAWPTLAMIAGAVLVQRRDV
jgi:hypothetical protein